VLGLEGYPPVGGLDASWPVSGRDPAGGGDAGGGEARPPACLLPGRLAGGLAREAGVDGVAGLLPPCWSPLAALICSVMASMSLAVNSA
jgi:hypothetical protein